jgi:type II secretory pathway component PulJ
VTLADLLVSTAVLGVTLGATLVTLEQGQQAWAVGTARVEAQQSGRAALAWLAAELRTAGQGTGPRRDAALAVAEPARVALRVDRNRDGVIAGPTETVTWRLAGDILVATPAAAPSPSSTVCARCGSRTSMPPARRPPTRPLSAGSASRW